MLARLAIDEKNWISWIIFGVASGLCIMSKVHGIFIWIGLILFMIFHKRRWFANPGFYAAILLSVLIASPIIIWNIQNNFVTYRFHIERVIPGNYSLRLNGIFREITGQVVLNNTFNVTLMALALLAILKRKNKIEESLKLYNFIALPLIITLLVISLYRHTFPHWSGPAYITLIPLAAIHLSEIRKERFFPTILKFSMGIYLLFLVVCMIVIKYYPGNFGNKRKEDLGKGDITLDLNGWKEAGQKFMDIYNKDIDDKRASAGSPVVCYKWWGSHLEYYFCRKSNIQMIGLGNLNDLHQYVWLNTTRVPRVNFNTAYCIIPSDEYYSVYDQYANYYEHADSIAVIRISRSHTPTHNFYVFRLTGWKNNSPFQK